MSDLGYCPDCNAPGVGRRRGTVYCLNGHGHAPDAFVHRATAPRVKEQLVESYLVQRVKETGGTVRKVRWDGHPGAPDRLCGWPGRGVTEERIVNGRHGLVELKRPHGKAEAHQKREHDRLRAIGFRVDVIDTKEGVDAYVKAMKP